MRVSAIYGIGLIGCWASSDTTARADQRRSTLDRLGRATAVEDFGVRELKTVERPTRFFRLR